MTLAERKAQARKSALAIRATCDPSRGKSLVDHITIAPGLSVAAFWPLPGEIDTIPLIHALHARGHRILLPETPPRGNPLIFRHWLPGCAMRTERFGTFCPEGEIGVPEAILVPFLAFDRQGRRLGYGGGYYDRTLAALPGVPAMGVGFAALELDVVPADDYDARLDAVATEAFVIACESHS
jgi:5-formyltetrahydrofolate cyclo-ligase